MKKNTFFVLWVIVIALGCNTSNSSLNIKNEVVRPCVRLTPNDSLFFVKKDTITVLGTTRETDIYLCNFAENKPSKIDLSDILYYVKDLNLYEYQSNKLIAENVRFINYNSCYEEIVYYIKLNYVIFEANNVLYYLVDDGIRLLDQTDVSVDNSSINFKKLILKNTKIVVCDTSSINEVVYPDSIYDFLKYEKIKLNPIGKIIYPENMIYIEPGGAVSYIDCFYYTGDLYYIKKGKKEYFQLDFWEISQEPKIFCN